MTRCSLLRVSRRRRDSGRPRITRNNLPTMIRKCFTFLKSDIPKHSRECLAPYSCFHTFDLLTGGGS
ncbi:hypothetical protein CAJAP_05741 [Camponotus japonicus]